MNFEMNREEFEERLEKLLQENGGTILVSKLVPQLKKAGYKIDKDTVKQSYGNPSTLTEALEKIPFIRAEGTYGKEQIWLKDAAAGSSGASSCQTPAQKPAGINSRIKELLGALNSGLYEKEEAVRLALLCAVAGENIFFLGPPGTAKSMISRRIRNAFKDAKYFEYLMNEFSSPDEIFGTIKLKGLDEGVYERNTQGCLPEADVAFLDEIWKSGPAILNTLLTIINEKKFHNGSKVEDVPLQILLAASNELPKEKAGLEALYDRFVMRVMVNPVEEEASFFSLCEGADGDTALPAENIRLSIEEVRDWRNEIAKVSLDGVKNVITEIRKEMTFKNQELEAEKKEKSEKEIARIEREKFSVSDRRWKKIVRLLKTSAFLCGRRAVDLMDCQLIAYCIWNTAEQREKAEEIVEKIVQHHGLEAPAGVEDIKNQIEGLKEEISEYWYKDVAKKCYRTTVHDGETYRILSNHENTNQKFYLKVGKADELFDDKFNIASAKMNYGNAAYSYVQREGDSLIFEASNGYNNTVKLELEYDTYTQNTKQKNKDRFDSQVYETLKQDFDRKYYQPILNEINKMKDSLTKFRAENEEPFSANLFARPEFKDVISAKLYEEQKELEDVAIVSLKEQQNRYAKDVAIVSLKEALSRYAESE